MNLLTWCVEGLWKVEKPFPRLSRSWYPLMDGPHSCCPLESAHGLASNAVDLIWCRAMERRVNGLWSMEIIWTAKKNEGDFVPSASTWPHRPSASSYVIIVLGSQKLDSKEVFGQQTEGTKLMLAQINDQKSHILPNTTQSWIAFRKLVATYNLAASLFCTAQSLFRTILDHGRLLLSQCSNSLTAAFAVQIWSHMGQRKNNFGTSPLQLQQRRPCDWQDKGGYQDKLKYHD